MDWSQDFATFRETACGNTAQIASRGYAACLSSSALVRGKPYSSPAALVASRKPSVYSMKSVPYSTTTSELANSAEGKMPSGRFEHVSSSISPMLGQKRRIEGCPARPTRKLPALQAAKQNVMNMSGFFRG